LRSGVPDLVQAADTIFDVVVHPPETPLIRQARKDGKQVITGAEVIALQTLEQFAREIGFTPALLVILS
jgi:shikimate dehydrogenase